MDYASSILGFLPGGRRSTGISQLLDKLEAYLSARPGRAGARSLRLRRGKAPGTKARFGRAVHHASGGGCRHSRRPAPGCRHLGGGDPARCHRGHADGEGGDRVDLRAGGRRAGRRRQQAGPDPVQEPPGSPGGELPQNAAGDGARHPRHHGQARGPHAQHAHPRRHAAGQAPAQRPRNPRDLRADRRALGTVRGQARARGPGLPRALSLPLQGSRARTEARARQPKGIHQQDRRDLQRRA